MIQNPSLKIRKQIKIRVWFLGHSPPAGMVKDHTLTFFLEPFPNEENMDEDEALAWKMAGRINRKNICEDEDDGDDDTDDTDTDDENTNANSTVPIEPNNSMSKNGGKGKKNRTN